MSARSLILTTCIAIQPWPRAPSASSKREQIVPNDRPKARCRSISTGSKVQRNQLAGGLGFEPRLAESESAVLPLDDPPSAEAPGRKSARKRPSRLLI